MPKIPKHPLLRQLLDSLRQWPESKQILKRKTHTETPGAKWARTAAEMAKEKSGIMCELGAAKGVRPANMNNGKLR